MCTVTINRVIPASCWCKVCWSLSEKTADHLLFDCPTFLVGWNPMCPSFSYNWKLDSIERHTRSVHALDVLHCCQCLVSQHLLIRCSIIFQPTTLNRIKLLHVAKSSIINSHCQVDQSDNNRIELTDDLYTHYSYRVRWNCVQPYLNHNWF